MSDLDIDSFRVHRIVEKIKQYRTTDQKTRLEYADKRTNGCYFDILLPELIKEYQSNIDHWSTMTHLKKGYLGENAHVVEQLFLDQAEKVLEWLQGKEKLRNLKIKDTKTDCIKTKKTKLLKLKTETK